ncbi:hypothetical protein [Mycobacteroides abscessus]|uniref:hypothetical protein n=1 Tax=Mycobacteroides abscessus TaxID=36809 RepID=UPI00104D4D46|nr:hypothetical protein [Mycobacteroides abscessus]
MATLVILTAMVVGTIVILAACVYKFRRTWTAAALGRYAPALQHLIVSTALSAMLLNVAFDPPFPIIWDEPISCATQTCVWEYYYVLLVIALVLLTLAAAATVLVLLCALLRAMVARGPSNESAEARTDLAVAEGESRV